MRKLIVFNNITLDGYFTDARGDMSWAHRHDPEWLEFVQGNASGGGGELLFGRKLTISWPATGQHPWPSRMIPWLQDR
jgi:hypothetical protein